MIVWDNLGWGGEGWRHMQGRAMCWVGYISLFTLVFVTCEDPLPRRQTGSVWQRQLRMTFPLLPLSFSHIPHSCHLFLPFTPSLYPTLVLCHPTNPHSPRTTCSFLLSTLSLRTHHNNQMFLSTQNLHQNNHICLLFIHH